MSVKTPWSFGLLGQKFDRRNLLKMLTALAALPGRAGARPAEGKALSLRSPDSRLTVTLTPPAGAGASPLFSVNFRGRELLQNSALGLELEGEGDLLAGARLTSTHRGSHNETYHMRMPSKQDPIRNQYRELTLNFTSSAGHKLQVFLRAFDDSLAFRYAIPAQPSLKQVVITDERTTFRLAGNPKTVFLYRDSYTTPHEGIYDIGVLKERKANTLIDLPALFEYEDGAAVAITEANLQHYAGMYLKSPADEEESGLVSTLSPLPGQTAIKVRVPTPMVSPWRVVMLGDHVGRLIESTVIPSLNEPCQIKDTSWIKPGKTTWTWWNGLAGEPVGFPTRLDLRTMKHYVDFCSQHGLAYHAVVSTAEPDVRPWYHQTKNGIAPGPDSDVTKPRPEIQMDELLRYAASKGVKLRLWVHQKALKPQIDKAFALYERWGIQGMMVDFLDRDDQEMVEFSETILKKAAEHHLQIQFHGVWKPTGRNRSYPNLTNHEGVLNLEYLRWSDLCTPQHNVTVTFTRMLAGPMDYHLGGFRAVTRTEFKPRKVGPVVIGTRCHHMATYIVYENPVPMVADYPSAYGNQPGFEVIERVPTLWDETRVLDARVAEYIVLARRKGKEWYVGAMTNWTPREIDIPLTFLGPGEFLVETWSDAPETIDDPNFLVKESRKVTARDTLHAKLVTGGGWVMHVNLADGAADAS